MTPSTIQFFSGSSPGLDAGTYTITLTHALTAVASSPPQQPPPDPLPSYEITQTFIVNAPEFTLPAGTILSQYPPDGGNDAYDAQLPYVVLSDINVAWERTPTPGATPQDPPQPWIALLIFAGTEIHIPQGSNSPVMTIPVEELLTPWMTEPELIKPMIDPAFVAQSVRDSLCQVIRVPLSSFLAVAPAASDLVYLAHRRVMTNIPGEPSQEVSVVLCNRLPVAASTPVKYYAHLVSLEGLEWLLPQHLSLDGGGGNDDGLHVMIVSLANWTFTSMPEPAVNFTSLAEGLVDSERATTLGALAVPFEPRVESNPFVPRYVYNGYTALDFHAFGTRTFAWYRGPYSAVTPAALPQVGDPPVDPLFAPSSDSLLIYLADQGLFDISYAAAWNLGRGLALANGSYCQAILSLRQRLASSLTLLAGRMAMPSFDGENDVETLLGRGVMRKRILRLMNEGLGRRWTEALETGRRAVPKRTRRTVDPQALLERDDVIAALSKSMAATSEIEGALAFIAGLTQLQGVPFSYLVPDPRMLPAESIRFFFVDASWVTALLAGALSIAIQTALDATIHAAVVAPALTAGALFPACGFFIRSQLVSAFPSLNISASTGTGADTVAVPIVSDTTPAPSIRRCLMSTLPDTVVLAQPYHSIQFGVATDGVELRSVTVGPDAPPPGQQSGSFLPPAPNNSYANFLTSYCTANGVVYISNLAQQMPGVGQDSGNFAMQLVIAPQQQQFVNGTVVSP